MSKFTDLWEAVKNTIRNDGVYVAAMSTVALVLLVYFSWWVCIDRSVEAKTLSSKSSKHKLVIDHDGGADDAMAVVMCILYEKYFNGMEVVALTTTHGNVNESQVFENSQRFLDITGRRDVPIYRGATQAILVSVESDFFFGYDGLGDNDNNSLVQPITEQDPHAAFGLIELSKKYKGELVVMAIGPLTNIALAQRLDPGFIGRLAQLYIGAGHIPSEHNTEPEFNADMDAEAYHIVTDSANVDIVTLIPFSQIYEHLHTTKEWRVNVLGAINTPIMQALNSYERISLATGKNKAWTLLDPAVAGIVLDPSTVGEFKLANNSINVCGTDRGININTLEAENSNLRLVYTFDEEAYKKLLINIFSAELDVCVKGNYNRKIKI